MEIRSHKFEKYLENFFKQGNDYAEPARFPCQVRQDHKKRSKSCEPEPYEYERYLYEF